MDQRISQGTTSVKLEKYAVSEPLTDRAAANITFSLICLNTLMIYVT